MKKIIASAALMCAATALTAYSQTVDKKAKVGAGLYQMVYNEKDNTVYVAAAGSRNDPESAKIYKLDPNTLEVKGSISTKESPAFGLNINTKTQTLYTSNTRTNAVSAIDIKTGKITNISHGKEKSHTVEIAVDETRNKVYVSNGSDIWVIDGKTNKFSHLIENIGEGLTGLALDEKANRLFVTHMASGEISIIDLKTDKVVSRFKSGGEGARNLYFDKKNNRLFVTNFRSGNLVVMTPDGKVLKTIETGAGALGVNYNAKKDLIYVSNRTAKTTSVIDGKTYEIKASVETGTFPQTIAVDEKSGRVFVTNKAQRRPRPKPGEEAPTGPAPEDPNGDTVVVIK